MHWCFDGLCTRFKIPFKQVKFAQNIFEKSSKNKWNCTDVRTLEYSSEILGLAPPLLRPQLSPRSF